MKDLCRFWAWVVLLALPAGCYSFDIKDEIKYSCASSADCAIDYRCSGFTGIEFPDQTCTQSGYLEMDDPTNLAKMRTEANDGDYIFFHCEAPFALLPYCVKGNVACGRDPTNAPITCNENQLCIVHGVSGLECVDASRLANPLMECVEDAQCDAAPCVLVLATNILTHSYMTWEDGEWFEQRYCLQP